MTGLLIIFVFLAVVTIFAALADRFGVDSREDSRDPRRSAYPVGI
jgi:hypothetical protein